LRLAPIVLVAAALAAGCGGSGDDESGVSRAEYAQQGNDICRAVQQQIQSLPIARPPTLEDLKEKTPAARRRVRLWTAYSEKVDRIGRKSQDDLLALTPPEGLQATREQLRKDLEQLDSVGAEANKAGTALREAAKNGDAAALQQARSKAQEIATRQGALVDRITNDFDNLGWTRCARRS
jgi:hypothetical protein